MEQTKKLYAVVRPAVPELTLLFVSDPNLAQNNGELCMQNHLVAQAAVNKPVLFIREITRAEDIPPDRVSNLLWGINETMTASEFLSEYQGDNQKDYQEYLRLKAIFEK